MPALRPGPAFRGENGTAQHALHRALHPRALQRFPEILYAEIPDARRFMHPDVVLNRVREDLALTFLPGLLRTYRITADRREEVDVQRFMARRGVELINVSDEEQRRWGTTFVPLEPGTIFHYDIALAPPPGASSTGAG